MKVKEENSKVQTDKLSIKMNSIIAFEAAVTNGPTQKLLNRKEDRTPNPITLTGTITNCNIGSIFTPLLYCSKKPE